MNSNNETENLPKVIVVNDDPLQASLLAGLLSRSGFSALPYENAQNALQAITSGLRPELIVTDLNMPGMDGWRFCRLLRSPEYRSLRDIPILVVSATFAGDDTCQTTSDLGANAFMSAPVDSREFIDTVHSLLRGDTSQDLSKVLLVLRDHDEAEILGKAFKAHEYAVDIACTGSQAENMAGKQKYDVAVLDGSLPDRSSSGLLKRFNDEHARTVCVMLSDGKAPELDMEWTGLGAYCCLRTPLDALYLLEMCAKARREKALQRVEELLEKRTRDLQESEQRYRSLFQSNHSVMLMVDPESGQILDANPAACRFYGWTHQELTSRKTFDLNILPETEVFREMKRAKNLICGHFFFKHRLASGEIRDVEVFSGPIVLDGQTMLYSIIHDITRRKQVENELLQSNTDLKNAESIARMGSWKFDQAKKLISGSEGFFRIIGQKNNGEISLEQLMDMVHEEDRADVDELRQKICTDYKPFDFECRIVVRERIKSLRVAGATQSRLETREFLVMGMVMDISEKKKLEQIEKEQQDQLAQASRMAALGTLVAGVAHEINNPNNLIMLNAPILEKVWNDALPVLREYEQKVQDFELAGTPFSLMCEYSVRLFAGINEGSKRIGNIISELKDFTRQSPLDMSRLVNINEVVESALTLLEKTIARHTDCFRVDLEPGLPLIRGDYQKLEQVMINLLINACQSLPDKSRSITLKTFHEATKQSVAVRITDQGTGITEEDMEHILEPFFSTKQDTGGTGLGLAITSSIVEDHNGSLHFDTVPGKGTAVTVYLGLSAQPQ